MSNLFFDAVVIGCNAVPFSIIHEAHTLIFDFLCGHLNGTFPTFNCNHRIKASFRSCCFCVARSRATVDFINLSSSVEPEEVDVGTAALVSLEILASSSLSAAISVNSLCRSPRLRDVLSFFDSFGVDFDFLLDFPVFEDDDEELELVLRFGISTVPVHVKIYEE